MFKTIGVERLRINVDGEGVTTLVAGYGCPLHCAYCLNPQCLDSRTKTESYSVEELLEKVSIDTLYFQATNGGITFGGGEPLLQADFIHSFKQKCPSSWKINLETSLNVSAELLEKVVEDIDCFIVDIKDMNPNIYKEYTGKSNSLVIDNLVRIKDKKVCIRIPHIPDYNTEEDVQRSIEQIQNMGFSWINEFTYNKQLSISKQRK